MEINNADKEIGPLVSPRWSPCSAPVPRPLESTGGNPGRFCSEASFAHLCGAAPVQASSDRHRLNRSGDRAANNALHATVLARMNYDQRTWAYVARQTAERMAKKDIVRCLKRFGAR